jgi:hypothetical protein
MAPPRFEIRDFQPLNALKSRKMLCHSVTSMTLSGLRVALAKFEPAI